MHSHPLLGQERGRKLAALCATIWYSRIGKTPQNGPSFFKPLFCDPVRRDKEGARTWNGLDEKTRKGGKHDSKAEVAEGKRQGKPVLAATARGGAYSLDFTPDEETFRQNNTAEKEIVGESKVTESVCFPRSSGHTRHARRDGRIRRAQIACELLLAPGLPSKWRKCRRHAFVPDFRRACIASPGMCATRWWNSRISELCEPRVTSPFWRRLEAAGRECHPRHNWRGTGGVLF